MKHTLSSLPLSNSFATLGNEFYSHVQPTPFESQAQLIHFNYQAAALLDLHPNAARDPQLAEIFTGARMLPGAKPIAMLYAGHQFGHFVPQLGDGRAIILGETTNQQGERWEIQLKGSGLTPYSRDGDGRAVLRSTIREYLCSEAMHALGIPTTRALCMVGSADEVYRERIEPGAMLTRLAPSHVRFGSFEVFFYRNQHQHIRRLADYVIGHHFPELEHEANPYATWLDTVIERTAALIAQWQAVGFSHGVMNTDNMSVLGLTIDYGPYGFMEAYEPGFICNHSDHQGRYAYNQQPNIGLFNLSCFAQAILPLLAQEVAQDESDAAIAQAVELAKQALAVYHARYLELYASHMRAKLGFNQVFQEDEALIKDLLSLMAQDRVDYTILFRALCSFTPGQHNHAIRDLFLQREAFDEWAKRYQQRLAKEYSEDPLRQAQMRRVNPKYILRNYMAETAIRKAEDDKDYSEIDRLITLLQSPYDEQPEHEHYAEFPPEWANNIAVSCSS
jgi:uncharacterized protein YdiU (UPF0061 family)